MTFPYSIAGLVGAGVKNVMFVFAGQSNMDDGTGTPPRFTTPNSKVKIYDSTAPAGWEDYQPLANASYVNPTTNWGPEVEFLYQYALANPDTNIWAIKVAQGGTNLAVQWLPPSGTWWTNLVNEYNAAQAALSALGVNITPAALIWMQGEADIGNSSYAENYGTNLTTFFAAIKTLMGSGIKIVCGRVADELLTESGYVYGTPIVRAAQVTVTRATSNAVIISTDPIPMTVPPHYDTADIDLLGEYFYKGFAGTYDDHPVNLDVTWLTGFEGGFVPSDTPPGTPIATLSADPGAYVGGSGMTYAEVTDPNDVVTVTGATLYLESSVVEDQVYTATWRAYNSIMGYTDAEVEITGAAEVGVPFAWESASHHGGSGFTLTNSDKTYTKSSDAHTSIRTNIGKSAGKWYVEVKIDAFPSANLSIGILDQQNSVPALTARFDTILDHAGGSASSGTAIRSGNFTQVNSVAAWGWALNKVIMIAFDADAKKAWLGDSGSWYASGNPATGANPSFTWTDAKEIYIGLNAYSNGAQMTLQDTGYSPPSGFTSLFF